MQKIDTELPLTRWEAELLARAKGSVTEAEIRRVVEQALRDLAGSVSRDSLPEMASRLAAIRIDVVQFLTEGSGP